MANGAVERGVVSVMAIDGYKYKWNAFSFWGVHDGETITFGATQYAGEQLTIQQVREQFPLPHEVKVMSDKKEWQGMQDGLPQVDTVCELWWGGIYNDDVEIIQYRKGGNQVVFWRISHDCADSAEMPTAQFRPLRTEREKWIERAIEVVGGKQAIISAEVVLGKIYDNMIKDAE